MDPRFLRIENFMCHKLTEIDCTQFQSVLIMGQSKSDLRESNGVGKTTIFHAIEYVLFGTYPTKVIDNIVRDDTTRCEVQFEFDLDGRIFRVERSRRRDKGSDIKLIEIIDGKDNDISQRTPTATHNELQRIIKMNVNAFRNSVKFSQNNIDGLIGNSSNKNGAASPEDRRTILREALNLGEYHKFEKIAKDKGAEFSKKVVEHQAVIDSIGKPQADITSLKNKLRDTKKQIRLKNKERDELEITINTKKGEISDLQKLVSSEVTSLNDKLVELKSSKSRSSRKIESAKASLLENTGRLTTVQSKLVIKKDELKELEAKSDGVRGQKRRAIMKVKQELEATTQAELDGKAFIASLESKANDLRKPMPDGEECGLCLQDLTHKAKEICKTKKRERLEDLLNEMADKRGKLKRATNKKLRLQAERDEINNAMAFISSLDTKTDGKKMEIDNDNDYIKRISDLNDNLNTELSVLNKRFEEINIRENTIVDAIAEVSVDEVDEKITSLRENLSELEINLQTVLDSITQANTHKGIYTGKIESRTEDLHKLNEKKKSKEMFQYKHSLMKRARRAFSPSGIPTLIINTILDDLQIEANHWLSELKPSLELQFTSDMDIIYRVHGRDKNFSQISGGQKVLFAFALKLGLSLIVQRRLGVNIKFLQLDEVDQPLDKCALEAYAEAIRKLQDKFKVFVITHNDSLKDKFTNVILVEGDEINGATSMLVEL